MTSVDAQNIVNSIADTNPKSIQNNETEVGIGEKSQDTQNRINDIASDNNELKNNKLENNKQSVEDIDSSKQNFPLLNGEANKNFEANQTTNIDKSNDEVEQPTQNVNINKENTKEDLKAFNENAETINEYLPETQKQETKNEIDHQESLNKVNNLKEQQPVLNENAHSIIQDEQQQSSLPIISPPNTSDLVNINSSAPIAKNTFTEFNSSSNTIAAHAQPVQTSIPDQRQAPNYLSTMQQPSVPALSANVPTYPAVNMIRTEQQNHFYQQQSSQPFQQQKPQTAVYNNSENATVAPNTTTRLTPQQQAFINQQKRMQQQQQQYAAGVNQSNRAGNYYDEHDSEGEYSVDASDGDEHSVYEPSNDELTDDEGGMPREDEDEDLLSDSEGLADELREPPKRPEPSFPNVVSENEYASDLDSGNDEYNYSSDQDDEDDIEDDDRLDINERDNQPPYKQQRLR